jgi:hypothetical protein
LTKVAESEKISIRDVTNLVDINPPKMKVWDENFSNLNPRQQIPPEKFENSSANFGDLNPFNNPHTS